MRPACRLAGSIGIVSLLAGVQSKTRLSCPLAITANTRSAAKTERFLIRKVFDGDPCRPREFQGKRLRKYCRQWQTGNQESRAFLGDFTHRSRLSCPTP